MGTRARPDCEEEPEMGPACGLVCRVFWFWSHRGVAGLHDMSNCSVANISLLCAPFHTEALCVCLLSPFGLGF